MMSKGLLILLAEGSDCGIISWASQLLLVARTSLEVPGNKPFESWMKALHPQLVPMDLHYSDDNRGPFIMCAVWPCIQVATPG